MRANQKEDELVEALEAANMAQFVLQDELETGRVRVHAHTYACACVRGCMRVCATNTQSTQSTHTHIHIHIHTYTYTHIDTQTHTVNTTHTYAHTYSLVEQERLLLSAEKAQLLEFKLVGKKTVRQINRQTDIVGRKVRNREHSFCV